MAAVARPARLAAPGETDENRSEQGRRGQDRRGLGNLRRLEEDGRLETGAARDVVTGSAGEYVAASMPPGHYELTATLAGFQNQKIEIDAGPAQTVVANFRLGVAALAENVTVAGVSPIIETSTISVGQVMVEKTVQEIPLNGRFILDVALLSPGTMVPSTNNRTFLAVPSGIGITAIRWSTAIHWDRRDPWRRLIRRIAGHRFAAAPLWRR